MEVGSSSAKQINAGIKHRLSNLFPIASLGAIIERRSGSHPAGWIEADGLGHSRYPSGDARRSGLELRLLFTTLEEFPPLVGCNIAATRNDPASLQVRDDRCLFITDCPLLYVIWHAFFLQRTAFLFAQLQPPYLLPEHKTKAPRLRSLTAPSPSLIT
jgi:hypothetical protein